MADESEVPVGVVASRFQDLPFRGDIWTEQLYRGISGTIGAIWRSRNTLIYRYPIPDFEHEVYKNMRERLDKYLHYYENEHKVGPDQRRTLTFELDGDVLFEIFNPEKAANKVDSRHRTGYMNAISRIAQDALTHNMNLDLIVNQYAGFGPESTDAEIGSRSEQVRGKLATFLESDMKIQGWTDYMRSKVTVGEMPADNEGYWEKYIDFAYESGAKQIRLSAEFTELFKYADTGRTEFNQSELGKFAEIIRYAKAKGLDFSLCLMHFTLPTFIKDGWENPDIAEILSNMSLTLINTLAERESENGNKGQYLPTSIYTINEPMAAIATGYIDGSWPPYKTAPNVGLGVDRVLRRFKYNGKPLSLPIDSLHRVEQILDRTVDFHVKVFEGLKRNPVLKQIPVGFTFNLPSYSAYSWFPADRLVSAMIEYVNEQWLQKVFERSRKSGKFLFDNFGLQYYNKYYVGIFKQTMAANAGVFSVPAWMKPYINGWSKFHEGMPEKIFRVNTMMLNLLEGLIDDKRHLSKLPDISIAEAGFPSVVDNEGEMMMLAKAIKVGSENSIFDLKKRGLFVWTLRNNFEWAAAYGDFGYLDRHGRQKPKSSSAIEGLNLREYSMHRQMARMINAAIAVKDKLEANGLDPELKRAFEEQLERTIAYHLEHRGKYFRMQQLFKFTGAILDDRNKKRT